jgi:Proline dehydrogenase
LADHLMLVPAQHRDACVKLLKAFTQSEQRALRACRYVPFGPLKEVMPYLIRRAQENSDVMGGVGKEMGMLRAEVKRRLTGRE